MSQKNKRKGTPTRPIWQVLAVVLVMGAIALAVWWYYTDIPATNDGADIIFMREEGNRVSNIYTLDIDDPEAEAIPLTDYTPDSIERIDSMGYPDGGSWVAYIEFTGNDSVIKKIDLTTGDISTIFECDTEVVQGCWSLDVSPNGWYAVFASHSETISEVVTWLLDLEDEAVLLTLLRDDHAEAAHFINNDIIAFWTFDPHGVMAYHIATDKIYSIGDRDSETISDQYTLSEVNYGASTPVHNQTIINQDGAVGSVVISEYADFHVSNLAWKPNSIEFLSRRGGFEANIIALGDSTTGEEQVLVEQAGYKVIGMAWNPDGTQFLFWGKPIDEMSYEGEIWVYDMESGEARALNEVGSNVSWLN